MVTYKITPISAADSPKAANLVPNHYLDTVGFMMVRYANCLTYIFINIYENIRIKVKITEK